MSHAPNPPTAPRWTTLRIAAGTLIIAAAMNAAIGHCAGELDGTRQEQLRVAGVDRGISGILGALDRARLGEKEIPSTDERDAAEAEMKAILHAEGRATTVAMGEAFDLCLAGIDREIAALHKGDTIQAMTESYAVRPAQDRLRAELAALDRRLQTRSETAVLATNLSSLGTLLLSALLVSYFAARHSRRTASLAALEVQSQSSEARERRFRLLLDVEDATQDLATPEAALQKAMVLLAEFLGAPTGAFERVDRCGQIIDPEASGLPRLAPDDLVHLRAGRSRVDGPLVRAPLGRDGDLRAVVSLQGAAGRVWRHDEIALVEEVASRCAAYLERAEAAEAVRRGEEHHRFVIDVSNDGVWEWHHDDDAVTWSERMYGILGFSPAVFAPTYASHRALVHPDDLPLYDEAMADQVESGEPFSLNLRFRQEDGGYLQALAQGRTQRDAAGRPIRTVGTLTDLTDVLEAERAKQKIERQSRWTTALLEAQLNSSPDGILIADINGNKVLQNRRMTEVWGLPDELNDDPDDHRQIEAASKRLKDPDTFVTVVREIYAHPERVQRDEIELVDGTILDRHTAPAIGSDGTIYGRIWTFRDITDRIRNEQDLEARVESRTRDLAAATHAAERANSAKSEFLSRMSHELRTPLNAILGFGQILQRQVDGELQKESVHYILKGGRHLLGLINEVLDLSRVETGNAELSIEPVPVGEVLDESLAMVRTAAADAGLALEEGLDGLDGVHVVADRQRLKQVLINLLSNAVKYNRPGGRIRVEVGEREDWLRIAVSDTGNGISEEGLAKLFTPFERLNAGAGIEGTGLGLFLTQRLVGAMGGRLTVESVVGEGTTFAVELEMARPPAECLAPTLEIVYHEPIGRELSVLCIEDNSSNLRLMEMVFAHRPNVSLLSANEGMAGFRTARESSPDLILLDLNLPDVSGVEVLTRLKRSGATSDIPVIMISADATPGRAEENLRAGAEAFLTKPLNVDLFLETFDRALRPRAHQEEAALRRAA